MTFSASLLVVVLALAADTPPPELEIRRLSHPAWGAFHRVIDPVPVCPHGPVCDVHTMEWDSLEDVNQYRVKWRVDPSDVGWWEPTLDDCWQACDPLPCRLRCDVQIIRPDPGEVVALTVVGVRDGTEGP